MGIASNISTSIITNISTSTPLNPHTKTLSQIIIQTFTPTVTSSNNFSDIPIIYPNPFNPQKIKLKILNMPSSLNMQIYTVSLENVESFSINNPITY